MKDQVRGACYCGAVKFHAEAAAQNIINCHCGLCRRLSGSAFTTWLSFSQSSFHLSGEQHLCTFHPTANTTRHFCSQCGTHVYTEDTRYPKIIGVPAGTIMSGVECMPQAHYFVSHKAAWHVINDTLPQFGGESGFERLPT